MTALAKSLLPDLGGAILSMFRPKQPGGIAWDTAEIAACLQRDGVRVTEADVYRILHREMERERGSQVHAG
jgi:hypothetical protein